MLGKIAGAFLGEKIAGRNNGAKGAILGYGAAALARRSVPALFLPLGVGTVTTPPSPNDVSNEPSRLKRATTVAAPRPPSATSFRCASSSSPKCSASNARLFRLPRTCCSKPD